MTAEDPDAFARGLSPGDIIHFSGAKYEFLYLEDMAGRLAVRCDKGFFWPQTIAPGSHFDVRITRLNNPIRRVTFQ